jgi:hypothetical protein
MKGNASNQTRGDELKRKGMGIAGLIVVTMMLAMVPNTAAWAFEAVGTIQYEDGATCPYGWDVYMENLNESYPGEPWYDESHSFILWDYKCAGEATSNDNYVIVNVTSRDEKWFGESGLIRLGDVYDTESTNYIINLVVSEQSLLPETFTKNLVTGWNLVSLPLTPDDNSTSAVLDSIPYDAVKSYNATTHQFEEVTTMGPGVGYFIHMTAADTWSYDGTAYESMRVGLSQGLNCVGWVNASADLSGALNSITGNYNYVASWNATSQSYEVYARNAPSEFNDFDTMERGEGYFIAAKTGCTLTYPHKLCR